MSRLTVNAVEAIDRILEHAVANQGVLSVGAVSEASWSVVYATPEKSCITMNTDADRAIIEVAEMAGLV
jgi:hypothetical protein